MVRKGLASYRKVQTNTASPGQKIVMLYDAVIKHIRSAQAAFELDGPEKYEVIHSSIQSAEQIVLELQLALDVENGGELAARLEALYDYWITQMSEANAKKDPAPLTEILDMVQDLRTTWSQAAEQARRQGM